MWATDEESGDTTPQSSYHFPSASPSVNTYTPHVSGSRRPEANRPSPHPPRSAPSPSPHLQPTAPIASFGSPMPARGFKEQTPETGEQEHHHHTPDHHHHTPEHHHHQSHGYDHLNDQQPEQHHHQHHHHHHPEEEAEHHHHVPREFYDPRQHAHDPDATTKHFANDVEMAPLQQPTNHRASQRVSQRMSNSNIPQHHTRALRDEDDGGEQERQLHPQHPQQHHHRRHHNEANRPPLHKSLSKMGQKSFYMAGKTVKNLHQVVQRDRNKMVRNMIARKQHMETTMRLLESTPSSTNLQRVKRMKTFVEKQIEHRMHGHPPHFTRLVTLLQLIIVVCMIALGKMAPFGMGIVKTNPTVPVFVGEAIQPMQTSKNPYYGPNVQTLVSWGSKWAPCMRAEQVLLDSINAAKTAESEYGCCRNSDGDCGMMSSDSCNAFNSDFFSVGQNCSSLECRNIILRPCCYGISGACAVITEGHCKAIDGMWNPHKELCSDDNQCIFEVCGMGYNYYQKNLFGYVHPNQFYRFLTSIFLHVGVIHFVMNALGQYVLVAQVEFVAGFWRTAVMYIVSGMCGFMISALFSSDQLSNGSSAAIYGMLGVETVDLFQSWQVVDQKFAQVCGLFIKLILFLGIGTLPYIDNFAHVGGFVSGIVVAICFLPYIVFGKFDEFRKRLFQVLSIFGLVALVIGLLYRFYTTGKIVCSFCKYIDCVPYTSNICDY
eukprot:c9577_g1_i1.p1 GENE.c9577_g1_i1~~c9577_g1_i1.p1  ORF type:complete len:715 (+),score=134.54 c9577_g1_i1:46-2190(+)